VGESGSNGKELMTIRSQLLVKLVPIAVVGMLVIVILLPYSLYRRDTSEIKKQAHQKVELIRKGLLGAMMNTGDPVVIRKIVDWYKNNDEFEFRMVRSKYVRKQFGDRKGETPKDQIEEDVLNGKLSESAILSGTDFRQVTPFVSDERCQKCHEDIDGTPIPIGSVMGVAEIKFSIEEMRNSSIKLTAIVAIGILVVFSLLFATLYYIFHHSILEPIRQITDDIESIENEIFDVTLVTPTTYEMEVLVNRVHKTAQTLMIRKIKRDKALEESKKLNEKIRSYAKEHAERLGIKDEDQIQWITDKFTKAVEDEKQTERVENLFEFVCKEKKKVIIGNRIDLISPLTYYLTRLIPKPVESIKKGSVQLALEEALMNAIIHGNLGVPSSLKDESNTKFEEKIEERKKEEPYSSRKVEVSYSYKENEVTYTISDEGDGFDWGLFINKSEEEMLMQTHGRGIMIMKAFGSSINYNEKGNSVTITFSAV